MAYFAKIITLVFGKLLVYKMRIPRNNRHFFTLRIQGFIEIELLDASCMSAHINQCMYNQLVMLCEIIFIRF